MGKYFLNKLYLNLVCKQSKGEKQNLKFLHKVFKGEKQNLMCLDWGFINVVDSVNVVQVDSQDKSYWR